MGSVFRPSDMFPVLLEMSIWLMIVLLSTSYPCAEDKWY